MLSKCFVYDEAGTKHTEVVMGKDTSIHRGGVTAACGMENNPHSKSRAEVYWICMHEGGTSEEKGNIAAYESNSKIHT